MKEEIIKGGGLVFWIFLGALSNPSLVILAGGPASKCRTGSPGEDASPGVSQQAARSRASGMRPSPSPPLRRCKSVAAACLPGRSLIGEACWPRHAFGVLACSKGSPMLMEESYSLGQEFLFFN